MTEPIEGVDYYYNEQGLIVLTEEYHRKRGVCCGNNCLHCPYDHENVPERSSEKSQKNVK